MPGVMGDGDVMGVMTDCPYCKGELAPIEAICCCKAGTPSVFEAEDAMVEGSVRAAAAEEAAPTALAF